MLVYWTICFCLLLTHANAAETSDDLRTISDLSYQNLTALNFTSNEAGTLSPDTLYLNLQGNDLRSIPNNISHYLPQLEKAILTDNPQLSFPSDGSPFLRSPTLIELLCERCGIRTISTRSLRHLPRLEYLRLSFNQIQRVAPHAFRRNRYLQNLDLSSNRLTTVPTKMLSGLFHVKDLDLSNNRELAPRNDAPFLASDVLEVLKCNDCGFTETFEDTFSELTNLKELHLKGNRIVTIPFLPTPTVLVLRRGSKLLSAISSEVKDDLNEDKKQKYLWWRNRTKVYL